jgi:hypothetical protein
MSIGSFNPPELWNMPPAVFNEWRAVNDLPNLYNYFLTKLPGFAKWATQFEIDSATFCRTTPTGNLF